MAFVKFSMDWYSRDAKWSFLQMASRSFLPRSVVGSAYSSIYLNEVGKDIEVNGVSANAYSPIEYTFPLK